MVAPSSAAFPTGKFPVSACSSFIFNLGAWRPTESFPTRTPVFHLFRSEPPPPLRGPKRDLLTCLNGPVDCARIFSPSVLCNVRFPSLSPGHADLFFSVLCSFLPPLRTPLLFAQDRQAFFFVTVVAVFGTLLEGFFPSFFSPICYMKTVLTQLFDFCINNSAGPPTSSPSPASYSRQCFLVSLA